METKKGLREIENIPVVISFPRLLESIPKRSDLLKHQSVNPIKTNEIVISSTPEIFKNIESIRLFEIKPGKTVKEI